MLSMYQHSSDVVAMLVLRLKLNLYLPCIERCLKLRYYSSIYLVLNLFYFLRASVIVELIK